MSRYLTIVSGNDSIRWGVDQWTSRTVAAVGAS